MIRRREQTADLPLPFIGHNGYITWLVGARHRNAGATDDWEKALDLFIAGLISMLSFIETGRATAVFGRCV